MPKEPKHPKDLGKRYQTFLTDEEWEAARQEGDGNLSLGIRRAVQKLKSTSPKNKTRK